MSSQGDSSPTITKLMSLAAHEFVMGCQRLAGDGDTVNAHQATIAVGQGSVEIRYEPLPGVRLGGLLELPRANVTLDYRDVSDADRDAFTNRFDMAFQRGGG